MNSSVSYLVSHEIPLGWDDFVKRSKHSVPFILSSFLNYSKQRTVFIIALNSDNKMIGGLVSRIRGTRSLFGFNFKVFWLDAFPIIDRQSCEKEIEIQTELLSLLKNEARKAGAIAITFSHWTRVRCDSLLKQADFEIKRYATFILDLREDEDSIFSRFSKTTRKKIKRASVNKAVCVKHLCGSEVYPFIEKFHAVHKKSYYKAVETSKNSAMSLRTASSIRDLVNSFGDNIFLSLAFQGETIVSGNLVIRCGKSLFPFIAGTDTESKESANSVSFLFWSFFLWAKRRGFEVYDMGGVPANPEVNHPAYGVYRFKKSFGGEYQEFYGGTHVINRARFGLFMKISKNKRILRIAKKIFKGKI